jgi:anti-anti-sigma regulatory factor
MPILIRREPDHTMTLQLTGTLDTTCVPDLERALESARHEHTRVVLDCGKLRLMDRPTLQYVADLIEDGVLSVVNCPDYVEGWIHRESVPAER